MNQFDRTSHKTQLWQAIADLGPQLALLPAAAPAIKAPIDQQVMALIADNPIPLPLDLGQDMRMLGDWELVYASRGTVVTRRLSQSGDPESGGAMTPLRIWQRLQAGESQGDRPTIQAENGARLRVPWLGEVQLLALGTWAIAPEPIQAEVSFRAFALQLIIPWGERTWTGPNLQIPVLPPLRRSALWRVVYLDADTYVGEGSTGNRFVFRRS
jgi:hypothetical protein